MVVLGKVTDPYGVQGWVRIHPFADDPATWAKLPRWWLSRDEAQWRQTAVRDSRIHGRDLLCLFDGVTERTAAESLKGFLVAVPREYMPSAEEGEYYWSDLIGLQVVNTAGETLGQVKSLIETGANDVLRVLSPDGTERLLPFVAQVVLAVEKDKGSIRVEWGSDW